MVSCVSFCPGPSGVKGPEAEAQGRHFVFLYCPQCSHPIFQGHPKPQEVLKEGWALVKGPLALGWGGVWEGVMVGGGAELQFGGKEEGRG